MSKPVPILRGRSTTDGKIQWNGVDGKKLAVMLKHMPEGTELEITVQKLRKRGSDEQRRYYWGVIVEMIVEKTGHSDDEVHNWLKWNFLRVEYADGVVTTRSYAKLNTLEREEFHEKCRRIIGDEFLKIYIPLPNEADY